ncbi:MAG: hypothetical protein LQ351_003936 [Letrouitia transgressa]|nr:MAG: hypothetical protein LQ351_003936 [Letrouitia transgressa]
MGRSLLHGSSSSVLPSPQLAEKRQALDAQENLLGVVISKLEHHKGGALRGYIAMLAVKKEHRGKGIATKLVRLAIDIMIEREADEIALETEVTNTAAMKLYERLGFLRSKRLHRYYLNGNSAFRFILFIRDSSAARLEYEKGPGGQPELPPSA